MTERELRLDGLTVLFPLHQMAGAPWNILDDGWLRIATCGTDGRHEKDGPGIAAMLVDACNRSDEQAQKIADLEHSRDQYRDAFNRAIGCVDRVFQECRENPSPILPDFAKLGEDKFAAVVRLAEEYVRVTAERDRLAQIVDRLTPGVAAIANERRRQIEEEGWPAVHDNSYRWGELSKAAACYSLVAGRQAGSANVTAVPAEFLDPPSRPMWPWDARWWKPKDIMRNLVRAGALIAAELDRISRQQSACGLVNDGRIEAPPPKPQAKGGA